MDNDILTIMHNKAEYYMRRGNNLYFRNIHGKLKVDSSGTAMRNYLVCGKQYNIELSIFADFNEF